jgi:hydrogenase-4 component E
MNGNEGFGVLAYDAAHLLDAGALVLSFLLLSQRRLPQVIALYAVQAVVLAAAAAWQGWVQGAPSLYVTAAITLAAKGVVIPIALQRIVRRLGVEGSTEAALGVFPSAALGVALVVLAILVVVPTTYGAHSVTREALAMALSVVLLGLLMMITRRNALSQAIGFLSLENGLILAAIGVPDMPMLVELSVAVLVLVAFVVFGVFLFRIRDQFDSLDVAHLDRISGVNR